jgi:glycosyltransferase involved in cell wall biosynthesis
MRIAQVAPLFESVPPRLYGGTERVVFWLTEALVAQGHNVTLFASGDSLTTAELVPCTPRALRLDPSMRDPVAHHVLQLEKVRQQADAFDVIHFHIDHYHYPLVRIMGLPHVTTRHGRQDLPDLPLLYQEFAELPQVSISLAQRAPVPWLNWAGNVYHGLPRGLHRFSPVPKGGYLAFLGRIAPEKRPDRAIEIARRTGLKLKIAAKVDAADRDYFEREIRGLLDDPLVEFVGEIAEHEKGAFLGGAIALLFPIDWPEPFGLVMIEAMACGTPVIAFRCGSVPEIVDEGVTGLIVGSVDAAVHAVGAAFRLDRAAVRRRFEERFTAERMARDYVAVYRRLLAASRPLRRGTATRSTFLPDW